jgi:hypothetical protein
MEEREPCHDSPFIGCLSRSTLRQVLLSSWILACSSSGLRAEGRTGAFGSLSLPELPPRVPLFWSVGLAVVGCRFNHTPSLTGRCRWHYELHCGRPQQQQGRHPLLRHLWYDAVSLRCYRPLCPHVQAGHRTGVLPTSKFKPLTIELADPSSGFVSGRVKAVADQIAEAGFLVAIPDIFNGGSVDDVGGFSMTEPVCANSIVAYATWPAMHCSPGLQRVCHGER